MSSPWSRRLLTRLHQDLAELQDNPYPGVAVFTDDANLRKLCLVLTPPGGPWKDLALHFAVELPDNWPSAPPRVSSSVENIKHPNLFGSYICCDLLRPIEMLERGYSGGYTPALTLRGLFLQFLTFFSSTKVDQDYGSTIEIGESEFVTYLWSHEVGRHLSGSRRHDDPCADKTLQKDLERIWTSERSKAQKFAAQPTGIQGEVLDHQTKLITSRNTVLHRIVRPNPRRISTLSLIRQWHCEKCPYGSTILPHDQTILTTKQDLIGRVPASLLQPPVTCQISLLNDDILGELGFQLPSESIISFSIAYPRFRDVVNSLHVLLRQELRCFFLRIPLNESILGIGVHLDAGPRTLSSDFDWLSMEAFDKFYVRNSIEKRPFSYFLPLAFNRAHFGRAHKEIWKRLSEIHAGLREAEVAITRKTKRPSNRRLGPPLKPHHVVDVVYRMMNNVVVSLMKSCEDTIGGRSSNSQTLMRASEKAVVSYCHLFHLLLRLCETTPAILLDANSRVRCFIDRPELRVKAHTPDMGELIVLVMLVLMLPVKDQQPITWENLCGKFLEEAITRNVLWVLKESPELEIMESGASDYRLNKTFDNSKTSLRLIMFQMTFLRSFIATYSSGTARLDGNYGFPDKEIPEQMVNEIKAIYQVDAWPKFFQRIEYARGPGFTKASFSDMLRETVKKSAEKKYHTPLTHHGRLEELRRKRMDIPR
ncbi:hypothetical protein M413DRAFT_445649 [Hebeloma cylindrosporum]|uniref:UBC core domain-containing protein n=1 Tax=Hebeloma cylindrosporum TaxID=76867 RepID=A0A0C2XT56_HEBCY|nr:hypothetical protein M413DRAFT_445649 [Hebeloma cylindrosporum h7]